jgi:hypothetical protein
MQHRENPLFGHNLNPDFTRAMNTPSKVGGVLARIADGLPWTPDAKGYRRLFTRAANHLLPLALSTARANDDTRMRSGTRKNMTGIMTSLRGVRPPELSRQRL